jgi:superfamily II DNA or RNA helicase
MLPLKERKDLKKLEKTDSKSLYYVGSKGFSIPKKYLTDEQIQKIKKDLTAKPFAPPTSMQKPVQFPIWRESPKKIYVPRFYGFKHFESYKTVLNKIPSGTSIDLPFSGSLRDYQVNIINAYMKESRKSGCGLLEIPCGRGKTVMALNIISQLKLKTLVIVHKEFLMNQWIERIQQFLPDARIGKIQGKVVDVENKDIVLGMLQSLSMKDYPDNTFSSFGLTVLDEVHHISAEVFSNSLFKIVTKHMLGLSATMNRKDGLTHVFKQFLGKVVYKEKRESDDKVLVRGIHYKNSDDDFSEVKYNYKGQVHYSVMISKICNFSHRTEFILQVLQDLFIEEPSQQVMILAHNKSILKYLFDAISTRKIQDGSVGYYIGGMKEVALKETEDKKIVLATYAMAEEALDIKTLSCLIMASPKTDVTQAVGRILRIKHKKPIVVDIIDQHENFQRQYYKRRNFYRKCNYKILETNSYRYQKNKEDFDLIYEPGEKASVFHKRMKLKESDTPFTGKCMIKIDI